MITREMIDRINALAKKKKTEGLTPEELAEQTHLRRMYLDTIRGRLKSTLDQIEFVEDSADRKKAVNEFPLH